MSIKHEEGQPSREDLDRMRACLAAERTQLAWIRTGLAMMGFGFIVARFGLFIREMVSLHPQTEQLSPGFSLWIGTALILLGVATHLITARQHFLFLRSFAVSPAAQHPGRGLGVAIAILLALLGLVMAAYLILLRF